MDPFIAEKAVRSRRAQLYAEAEQDALVAALERRPNIGARLLAAGSRMALRVGPLISPLAFFMDRAFHPISRRSERG